MSKEPYVIDCNGSHLSIAVLDAIIEACNSGAEEVVIRNCSGANILDIGMMLMANYEKMKDKDRVTR